MRKAQQAIFAPWLHAIQNNNTHALQQLAATTKDISQIPLLHMCAQAGAEQALQHAIQICKQHALFDAHLNDTKLYQGLTPLHLASAAANQNQRNANFYACAQLLLEHGAQIDVPAQDTGYTALSLAAMYKQTPIAYLLMQRGANVNAQGFGYNDGVLHLAIESNSCDLVQLLLAKGAKLDMQDKSGMNATELVHSSMASYSLRALWNRVEQVDQSEWTKYQEAMHRLWFEQQENISDSLFNNSIVHVAAMNGNADKILEYRNRIQDTNILGWNALTWLCVNQVRDFPSRSKTLSCLIQNGINTNMPTVEGKTVISMVGNLEASTAQILLEQGGAQLNAKQLLDNSTPLMHLCAQSSLENDTMSYIIRVAKDTVNETMDDGSNALLFACAAKHPTVVKQLLAYGATDAQQLETGLNSLLIAAERNELEIVKMLVEQLQVSVHSENHDGATALFYAVQAENEQMIRYLLDHGADINKTMVSGATPLMIASVALKPNMVTLLLELGADKNSKDKAGLTALAYAQNAGNAEQIVDLLKASS